MSSREKSLRLEASWIRSRGRPTKDGERKKYQLTEDVARLRRNGCHCTYILKTELSIKSGQPN